MNNNVLCRMTIWVFLVFLISSANSIHAAETNLQELLNTTQIKSKNLEAEINKLKKAKIDYRLPDSALAISELYINFAKIDIKNPELKDNVVSTLTYICQMLDETLIEVADVLAGKATYENIPEWDVTNLKAHNGHIWSGKEPVFLTGFNWNAKPGHVNPSLMKRLGVNLLDGVVIGAQNPDGALRASVFAGREGPRLDSAKENNFAVDCLLSQSPPQWLYNKFEDLKSPHFGHYQKYAIDHPEFQKYLKNLMAKLLPLYAKKKALFSIDLMNEPAFQGVSAYTLKDWRKWLKGKYGDIQSLNARWYTAFSSYDDIKRNIVQPAERKSPWSRNLKFDLDKPGNRAQLYDWCVFNKERVTSYISILNDQVKTYAPDVATHVKVMLHEYFTGSNERRGWKLPINYNTYGIDLQAILGLSVGITGGDMGLFPLGEKSRGNPFRGSSPYIMDWLNNSLVLDFITSLYPQKPYFNSEWHAVEPVDGTGDERIRNSHMRSALWYAHLRGMQANLLWYWARDLSGAISGKQWYKNSLLHQPWVLYTYTQESLKLRRFVRPVTAFSRQPRPIRILYSETSAILDVHHNDVLREVYEALNFLGIPVGFITERDIAEGRIPDDIKLLVIPNARYATDKAAKALADVVKIIPKTIAIDKDCFAYTTGGNKRSLALSSKVEIISLSDPFKYHAYFNKITSKLDIKPLLQVVDKAGKPLWGVEVRTVNESSKDYAYIINLLDKPVKITLKWKKEGLRLINIHDKKAVVQGVTLSPGEVLMGQIIKK